MRAKGFFAAMVMVGMVLAACGCGGARMENVTEAGMVSVVINAPPAKVFAFVSDPQKAEQWTWAKVENPQAQKVGRTVDWTVDVAGMSFKGQTVTVDVVPNQRIVEQFMGDADGSNTYLFVPEGAGTRVILVQQASVDVPRAARKMVVEKNKETLQEALNKLKAAVEK
ncbi:MAG TPA: SRPBCC family protein [bacterium]|nr:SRPBCC family protein [bacterium]